MDASLRECHALAAREADGRDIAKLSRQDWKKHFEVVELDPKALWLLDVYGLFDSMNLCCGTYFEIGYEDAELRADKLPMFMECIETSKIKALAAGQTDLCVWDELRALTNGAQARGVSVWIMF